VNDLSAEGTSQEAVVCETMYEVIFAAPMLLLFQVHDLLDGVEFEL
jgi:hypothetical protein